MNLIKWTLTTTTALLFCSNIAIAQEDSLGVIGDNLDLQAVLASFKNSSSVEEFEKTLNDQNSKLNNLDLNEDEEVDYIQVHDEEEDGAHALILRIDLDENETQDVAVIELEKSGDDEATIQIVGDEEIYGENYIIEPKGDEQITERLMAPNLVIVNVWGWPIVRFIYGPKYKRWRSPYRWGVYPKWWKPWKPFRWRAYHNFHKRHHKHFHRVTVRRCSRSHVIYKKRRRTTVVIHHHHHYHGKNKVHHKNSHHKNQGGTKKPTKSGNKKPVRKGGGKKVRRK